MQAHEIEFGTLHPDESLTDQRSIKQSDIMKCKHFIIDQLHYREDGICKCDDREHRDMMIREWGYTEDQFTKIKKPSMKRSRK